MIVSVCRVLFMITTQYFRISSSTYVRHCFGVWAGKWWWALVIPIAALVIPGLSDARFLIAVFALLLVIYPGLLALIYFSYALRPQAAYSLLSRRMTFTNDGILIEYEPTDEYRIPADTHVPRGSIARTEDDGSHMVIMLKSSAYDLLILPVEVFKKDDLKKVLPMISNVLK